MLLFSGLEFSEMKPLPAALLCLKTFGFKLNDPLATVVIWLPDKSTVANALNWRISTGTLVNLLFVKFKLVIGFSSVSDKRMAFRILLICESSKLKPSQEMEIVTPSSEYLQVHGSIPEGQVFCWSLHKIQFQIVKKNEINSNCFTGKIVVDGVVVVATVVESSVVVRIVVVSTVEGSSLVVGIVVVSTVEGPSLVVGIVVVSVGVVVSSSVLAVYLN